jgi:hypothetical protein
MFEQSDERDDKVRSRIIVAVAGIGVAAIIGAIVLYGALRPATSSDAPKAPPSLPNAKHAGDPEFDHNVGLVALTEKKFFTQANMLGQVQAVMTGTIRNFNDRPVVGIELRGIVLGPDGKVIASAIAMPVPKRYDQIPPKGNVPYAVTVDGVPNGQIDDMQIEVVGLVMGGQDASSAPPK